MIGKDGSDGKSPGLEDAIHASERYHSPDSVSLGDAGSEALQKLQKQHVGEGEWRPEGWDDSKEDARVKAEEKIKAAMADLKSKIPAELYQRVVESIGKPEGDEARLKVIADLREELGADGFEAFQKDTEVELPATLSYAGDGAPVSAFTAPENDKAENPTIPLMYERKRYGD
ncbi:hypothetical protein KKD03_02995 [Patescibacteria group bacterium]|nr:hypothetical protein [Patescibacteria group bacterium]